MIEINAAMGINHHNTKFIVLELTMHTAFFF
jgi:hypothetical protein